jgi:hypothetical protein
MTFEFSSRTKDIISNFSAINPSLHFKPGNLLKTITDHQDIIAEASIVETIPQEFAVGELSRLLGALSLFKNPRVEFFDTMLTIYEETRKLNFVYADMEAVTAYPENTLTLPPVITSFKLFEKDFTALNKAANFLKVPTISLRANDGKVNVEGINPENPTGDSYTCQVGTSEKEFNVFINADKFLKLIPGEYQIDITYGPIKGVDVGIGVFTTQDVKYFIATEDTSVYE